MVDTTHTQQTQDAQHCPACGRGAARCSAEADPPHAPDDGRRNYVVDGCGHPRLIGPNGRIVECRLCDASRPTAPEMRLSATELYSIDVMAAVDTVSWWCRLCDHEATVASAPAADTAAVEHFTAQHGAVVDPT